MAFFNRERKEAENSALPSALIEALKLVDSQSIVLPAGEGRTYLSDGVVNYGIVKDGRIQSEELLAMISEARRSKTIVRGVIDIPRGLSELNVRTLSVTVSVIDPLGTTLVLLVDESEWNRIDSIRRDFVTNVSHELKTPISAIGFLAESIIGSKNDPEMVEKWAHKMQNESKRLNNLVQEIINLSELQDFDPLELPHQVKVGDVIRQAVNRSETNADSHNITIDYSGESEEVVLGNQEHLIMALHNLIENAINYSANGTKVTVTVKAENGVVEISVIDQGIGIPESEIDRIFERFYRVDPARSRETGGTGLGLSIVKHVVTNHGGEIKVWSSQGVGSTFAMRLPQFKGVE
jgi:two-component system sensor histidine kinase SenX3